MKKLSIIIPAYNEGKRISKTLDAYIKYFSKKLKNDFEILVVLNGCTDDTLDVVRQFTKHKSVKYKNFSEKIGKGGAIIEGLKMADSELIGFVDADLCTKPEAFYELINNIKDYDGVIASRWIKGAKVEIKQPIMRRIASRGFNILVRTFFGIQIRDSQCGAKLFKHHAIKQVVNDLGISNWAFDIDLLYLMKRNNFKIKEVPTEWREPGDSHLRIMKTASEMFLAITRLRLMYSPFKFVVKLYDRLTSK